MDPANQSCCQTRKSMLSAAFTLVELVVSMAVFLILMVMVFQIVQGTTKIWTNSANQVTAFTQARDAFEAVTRTISQATLNPYTDYVDSGGNFRNPSPAPFTAASYRRRSDLHFICGKALLPNSVIPNPITHSIFFQAPLGYSQATGYQVLQNLPNACGFYLFYGPDPATPSAAASIIPKTYRFRLMQFVQPAEGLGIYDPSVNSNTSNWYSTFWFLNPLQIDAAAATPVSTSEMAENVVALVILPEYSQTDQTNTKITNGPLSPKYEYDSRAVDNPNNDATNNPNFINQFDQLPPLVQVVMFVIDERSAVLLGNSSAVPNLGTQNLFVDSTMLSADITTLEHNLSALPNNAAGNRVPLTFEVFQSEVAIPGSKWSTN